MLEATLYEWDHYPDDVRTALNESLLKFKQEHQGCRKPMVAAQFIQLTVLPSSIGTDFQVGCVFCQKTQYLAGGEP